MRIRQTIKRYVAVLLCVVMTLQNVLTGTADIGTYAEPQGDIYNLSGTPKNAYRLLQIEFANKVGDQNALWFRISGELNDGYLQNEYEKFLYDDEGNPKGMDEADWDKDHQGYNSYDEYLNAQSELRDISFNVKLNLAEGISFDIGKMLEGDIVTDASGDSSGEVIGRYSLTVSSQGTSPMLRVTLDKKVYNRYNVKFGENIFAGFSDNCNSDNDIVIYPGNGSNDFTVEVVDYGNGTPEETGYSIDKKAKRAEGDPLSIIYTISAKVDGAEPARRASLSQLKAPSADKKTDKAASNSEPDEDRELNPDDDEAWEEDGDGSYNGPGIFSSLIDALVPEQDTADIGSKSQTREDLAGKIITDRIPAGLTIVNVEARINSSSDNDFKPIEENGPDGYIIEDGVIKYVIPASGDSDINFADLRITTRLSDEEYNNFMLQGEKKTWNFTNKAYLKGADGDNLDISPKAPAEIELLAPFSKEGKPLDSAKREFEWTLNVNSYFMAGSVRMYAVDFIEDSNHTHDYKSGDGNKVFIDGAEKEINDLGTLTDISDTFAYEKITNLSVIDVFLESHKEKITDDTAPIVYRYLAKAGDGGDTTKDIYNSVMLIPLTGYENRQFKITYETAVTLSIEEMFGGNIPLELKNHAKILWKWLNGGIGTGGEDFGSATIGKEGPYTCSLVSKTAPTDYDETNNTIEWKFEINQLGLNADWIRIEDTFTKSEQVLLGLKKSDGAYGNILLSSYPESVPAVSRKDGIPYSVTEKAPGQGDYYTLTDCSDANGKPAVKLTIFLERLNEKEHYGITVKTFVTDPALTTNSAEMTVSNTANVTVKRGDEEKSFDTSAKCTVANTLIRKTAIPFENGEFYNYTDNTVKWRVTINPHSWKIKDAVITDTMPGGTHFAELKSASVGSQPLTLAHDPNDKWGPGVWPKQPWSAAVPGGTFKVEVQQESDGTLKFTFINEQDPDGEIILDKPCTFEFTTHVTSAKRNEIFRSSKTEKSSLSKLENKAELTGWWIDKDDSAIKVEIKASDAAVNTVLPSPVTKNGVYFEGKPVQIGEDKEEKAYGVNWSLLVNRTCSDMADAEITDNIRDCMELVKNTMEVYTVELDAKGGEKIGSEKMIYPTPADPYTVPFTFTTLEFDKFVAVIPPEYKTNTLKFKFTTVMVDDANTADITNDVSIKGKGWGDKTDNAVVDKVEDFYLDNYAQASTLSFLKLYKTSKNELQDFPLREATFEIYELTTPAQGTELITSWDPDGSAGTKIKTRTTNSRGSLSFMFLKKNTMYKIVETKAPEGYRLSTMKWYVVPSPKEGTVYPTSDAGASPSYTVAVKEGNKNYQSLSVPNEAEGTGTVNLEFTKQGQGGQILEGVKFDAVHPNLATRSATSGNDGTVKFDTLEPNQRYTIREIAPKGYKGVTLYAETKWDQTSSKSSAQIVPPYPPGFNSESDPNTLTNEPIIKSGSFTKTDQNIMPLLNNPVTFIIERRGDGGDLLNASGAVGDLQICLDVDSDPKMGKLTANGGSIQSSKAYYLYRPESEVTSDNTGVVLLENLLYGDYKLKEKALPANALTGTDLAEIYVRVNEKGIFASNNSFDMDSLNSWQGTNIADGSQFKVVNNMQYGALQINKVVGDRDTNGTLVPVQNAGTNLSLTGMRFEVYYNKGTEDVPAKGDKLLTLVTEHGNFEQNADGSYTDADNADAKRWLVTGSYILEEEKDSRYVTLSDDDKHTFNVENGKITYIGWDGTTFTTTQVAKDNLPDTATLFLNEIKRGSLALQKVDKDKPDTKLTSAEFEVWDKDDQKYITNLKYNDSAAAYILQAPVSAHEDYAAADADGKPYLRVGADGTYTIIYGDYTLRETKTPVNYTEPLSSARFKVRVDSEKVMKLSAGGNLTNEIIKKDLEFTKRVEIREQDGTSFGTKFLDYAPGEGFGFTLELKPGETALGGNFQRKEVKAEKNGAVKFPGVPVGTYILTETYIPEKYGTIANPYVELMKPIIVTVTKDGISYEYRDAAADAPATLLPNHPDIQAEMGTTKTAVEAGKLIVRNNCVYGSAAGTKMGILPAKLSGYESADGIVLKEIKFILTNKAGLSMSVKSDSKGKISFSNLPYGTYTLTEEAPSGYTGVSIPFEVKNTIPVVIATDGSQTIDNTLILKSFKFLKTDQNGEPLTMDGAGRIKFKIARTAGSEPSALPGTYQIPAEVYAQDGGVIEVKNLPYGTYELEEVLPADSVIDSASAKKISVTIGKSGTDKTKTAVTITPADAAAGGKSISLADSDSSVYDFTTGDNIFKLANTVKHGDIRISKILAERSGDGTSVSPSGVKLPGVQFNIYKRVGDKPDSAVFISLKTGSDGNFVKDGNGKYAGKDIPVGSYYLKEVLDAAVYEPIAGANETIPFEVLDSSATGQVTEFSYDGTAAAVSYPGKNTAAGQGFYNVARRGTITLTKTDSTNSKLPVSGALFGVYLDAECKEQAAHLKDSKSVPGIYTLDGSGFTGKTNAEGIPYINLAASSSGLWKILPGTYYVKELTSPEGYILSEQVYAVSVSAVGEGSEAKVSVTNAPVGYGSAEFLKTDAENGGAVKGAEFDIYTSGSPAKKVGILRDQGDGKYQPYPGIGTGYVLLNPSGLPYIKDVSGSSRLLSGSYYITETKAPAGYALPASADNRWEFTIAKDGKITNNALGPMNGQKPKAFTNVLWARDVAVQKQVEELLAGDFHPAGTQETDDIFTFRLEGNQSNGKPYKNTAVTDSQGNAVFASVPAGEYRLTELLTGDAKQAAGLQLSDVYNTTVPAGGITVKVNEKGVFYASDSDTTAPAVKNTLKRGTVTGHKYTEDESGRINLAGAEFELRPISPARAGILYAKSDLKGEFVFNDVPIGTYELREIKTPDANHYKENNTVMLVRVTAEKQNVTTGTADGGRDQTIEFVNDAFGTITLKKQAQVIAGNGIGDIDGVMRPGGGFVFKITGSSLHGAAIQSFLTPADVKGAQNVDIAADGIYVTTGTTGTVEINNLPVGDYKVQEQLNEKNSETGVYIPDSQEKTADITVSRSTGAVSNPVLTVENRLKRGLIQGLKTTEDKKTPLAGAVIGLFPAGTTSFTEADLWCGQKFTTGADGIYLFENIPWGTYLVAELAAPSGYNLNTAIKYEVTVASGTLKTTGFLLEGNQPKAAEETPILISNTKKPSGGGGGGGGGGDKPRPPEPTAPGPGSETTPTIPGETNPVETTPLETLPLPTAPAESNPEGGTDVIVPPATPPGTDVEVRDPNGDTIFTGRTDENGRVHVELPPGVYTLVMLDENQVPLGSMTFTIEDTMTPLGMLAAPDAGDHSVPLALLGGLMIVSLAGMILIGRRKKNDKKQSDGKE